MTVRAGIDSTGVTACIARAIHRAGVGLNGSIQRVNIGPNLIYVGSFAAILWRQTHGGDDGAGRFVPGCRGLFTD